jgi:thiamine pyrophosphokinase
MENYQRAGHRQAVIFTGGNLGEWAVDLIHSEDYLIGADRGADFLVRHGFVPHLSVGDFDSVTPDQMRLIQDTHLS